MQHMQNYAENMKDIASHWCKCNVECVIDSFFYYLVNMNVTALIFLLGESQSEKKKKNLHTIFVIHTSDGDFRLFFRLIKHRDILLLISSKLSAHQPSVCFCWLLSDLNAATYSHVGKTNSFFLLVLIIFVVTRCAHTLGVTVLLLTESWTTLFVCVDEVSCLYK